MTTIAATSAIPWLPTTNALAESEMGLAEQIAMMLRAEHQVVVLVTGRDVGRMNGFLADLTHAVTHSDSVLRIKAALDTHELFVALAGQLNVQANGLSPMQLAAKVGERLNQAAPRGSFVLLCEGAHLFSKALLEAIRQLSNYPINIVLCGHRPLLRHIARASLNQRVNYRIELDAVHFTTAFKWLVVLVIFAGVAYAGISWLSRKPAKEPEVIQLISSTAEPTPQLQHSLDLLPALPALPAANDTETEPDREVALVFDPALKTRPSPPPKP